MAIPVIDMKKLNGEERELTVAKIKNACQEWGFFQILNHGILHGLLDRVKELFKEYYKNSMDTEFQKSEIAGMLETAVSPGKNSGSTKIDGDWETGFFLKEETYETVSPPMPTKVKETMKELAERVLDIICENLGLEKGYLKDALAGAKGKDNAPFFGIKMAHYPPFPKPDLVDGLRSHLDAGGVILLLQDDEVGGLQVLKDELSKFETHLLLCASKHNGEGHTAEDINAHRDRK